MSRRPRARASLLVAAIGAALAASGCGGGGAKSEIPLAGFYARAAFHLMLDCGPEPGVFHEADLLYPANGAHDTFAFTEDPQSSAVTLAWDGEVLGQGDRQGDDVDVRITRHDPFSPAEAAPWRFHGRVHEDYVFHERTLVGQIDTGRYDDGEETCTIAPRSVAWFTTRPRALDTASVGFSRDALARGEWNRFVWFLFIGPLPLERKGDPGQRGNNIEAFSFLSTAGGAVTATDSSASADDGLPEDGGGAHPASARGTALRYDSTNGNWETHLGMDVLWDDGMPRGTSPGVRRVLAGFVTGSVFVDGSLYPAGWTGPTGMVEMETPGLAYFLDLDSAPATQLVRRVPRVYRP
ncbi:MAG TPA: hypothetical protein VMV18_08850 [bacterium]|nr:hypothetical protein [bacterium]